MDETAFKAAYGESRNGANFMVRHPLVRSFLYSDGVQDCAKAGCYWLLDILATELPAEFTRRPGEHMCVVTVKVEHATAQIVGEFLDDDPSPYRRHVHYTDLPDGEWVFYVTSFGDEGIACILPTEY